MFGFGFIKNAIVGELDHLANKKLLAMIEQDEDEAAADGKEPKVLSPAAKKRKAEKRWLRLRCMNLTSAVARAEQSGEDQSEEGYRLKQERLEAIARFKAQADAIEV